MTSKSILIISSYTVSKLRRFFETQYNINKFVNHDMSIFIHKISSTV